MAKRKRATKDVKALGGAVCESIGALLSASGWQIGTVGPCEVRAYGLDGDKSGKALTVYEFVAKFYGMKKPVCESQA